MAVAGQGDSRWPKGTAADLFDPACIPATNPPVGHSPGPRRETYAFTYTGYLKVPEDGVYTLHAPHEYTHCDQVAGYELQVYLGHALNPDNNGVKRDEDLNYWYPATRLHGFGTWSVPLDKGLHEFKVVYIDFRTDGPRRLNRLPGVPDVVWPGDQPGPADLRPRHARSSRSRRRGCGGSRRYNQGKPFSREPGTGT